MPGLIGPDEVRRVAQAAFELPGAEVEVLFMHEWGGLTRFASSSIHQSTHREDTGIRVRVVADGRIGVAGSNDFSPEGARRAAESALEMAMVAAPDPQFPGLAPPASVPETDRFDEATATTSPRARAEGVADLVGQCPEGFTAAGAYETLASEVAVANSNGQFCWSPSSQASVTTVVSGDDGGSGFAEVFATGVDGVDPAAIGRRAADKAVASRAPADLEPGRYPVVLEPSAVSTLVGFLAWVGFGGRALHEGRSCFSGKQGAAGRSAGGLDLRRRHGRGDARPPVRFRRRAEIAGRPDPGRRLPRRRLRPADRQSSRDEDDRSRAPAAEPGGPLPPQPVHGARRSEPGRDDRRDGARPA